MKILLDKEQRNKVGIYQIINSTNGKVYIGQTINFIRRAQQHRRELIKGVHGNHHLQSAALKYGIESFEFSPLEFCVVGKLNEIESSYLSIYKNNKQNCYNHKFSVNKQVKSNKNLSDAIIASWKDDDSRRKQTSDNLKKIHNENPEMRYNGRKIRKYIGPNKELYSVHDLKQFCLENNLNYEVMRKMSKGQYISHNGWTSADIIKEKKETIESKTKTYVFLSPNNILEETKNIANFARTFCLDRKAVFNLISGKIKHVKKWTFVEIKLNHQ